MKDEYEFNPCTTRRQATTNAVRSVYGEPVFDLSKLEKIAEELEPLRKEAQETKEILESYGLQEVGIGVYRAPKDFDVAQAYAAGMKAAAETNLDMQASLERVRARCMAALGRGERVVLEIKGVPVATFDPWRE